MLQVPPEVRRRHVRLHKWKVSILVSIGNGSASMWVNLITKCLMGFSDISIASAWMNLMGGVTLLIHKCQILWQPQFVDYGKSSGWVLLSHICHKMLHRFAKCEWSKNGLFLNGSNRSPSFTSRQFLKWNQAAPNQDFHCLQTFS